MIFDNLTAGAKKLSQKVQHSASDLKKSTEKNLKRVTGEASNTTNNIASQAKKRISDTAKTISNKTR
jgi:vacuolar-type H+-ATPase subunit E/Vma4